MKLSPELLNKCEWTVVGPMGPTVPPALLRHPLLCVDGGAHFCDLPDVWVGDNDSYQKEVKAKNIFTFSSHKDLSDLALALTLLTQDSLKLHCWGLVGGRKDHELFNLGEMLHFLEKKNDGEAIFYGTSPDSIVLKCFGPGQRSFTHQGPFSVASLRPIKLTLQGDCEYKLTAPTELVPLSSLGLSNRAHGTVTFASDGPLMILFPESK